MVSVFLDTRQNYAGGAYGYRCVSEATSIIRRKAPGQRIVPIRDAILYIDILPPLFRLPDFFEAKFLGVNSSELLQYHK